MKFEDDRFLHVCKSIERELVQEYVANPGLTDSRCIFALDRSKIAVKQAFGYAANESAQIDADLAGILDRCVSVARQYVDQPIGRRSRRSLRCRAVDSAAGWSHQARIRRLAVDLCAGQQRGSAQTTFVSILQ